MRILVLCEGSDEQTIINILLDNNKLKFNRDSLIGQRVYHARNLNNPMITTELIHNGKPVIIYRIGDTQTDNLRIPNDFKNLINKDRIYKYCTKPELEMLLLISENMINDYNKVKSKIKPSTYAKRIVYNGQNYNKSTTFFEQYYNTNKVDKLVQSIKEYKRLKNKTHKSDELFLADLLK